MDNKKPIGTLIISRGRLLISQQVLAEFAGDLEAPQRAKHFKGMGFEHSLKDREFEVSVERVGKRLRVVVEIPDLEPESEA